MVVGITGKYGSGKSTLSNYIVNKYGFIYYDTDTIFKILKEKGIFDFKIENQVDFYNSFHTQNIVRHNFHPKVFRFIKNEIDKKIKANKNYNFIIETALPSNYFFSICDYTIYIINKLKSKKQIILDERNIQNNSLIKIINIQNFYNKYYKKCDFKIINNNSLIDLYKKFDVVINKILEY